MRLLTQLLLWVLLPLVSQAQTANELLDALQTKMNKVKDYSVNATIKADIPLIKILPVKATIYFKQKDKFKIESKGITILPKQGFTDISKLLKQQDSYSAIITASETFQKTATQVVTILPSSDTSDIVLVKLWIDPINAIVLKSQFTTRSSGTITTTYTYGAQKAYGLPDSIEFTVDVKKFKIPKGVATDINKTTDNSKKATAKTGKIYITLTGYVINKGIKDAVFSK